MPWVEREHEPIRQSVRVDCPIEDAFRLFTEDFAEWWPLALHSITGDDALSCEIEPWVGGRIFERTRSGEEHEWGSVIGWDPPEHVKFAWHRSGPGDRVQTVDVQFRVEADGTRVTLIHTGWDAPGISTCQLRTEHAANWSVILERCFAEFVSAQVLLAV